jgi:hypothetical protein
MAKIYIWNKSGKNVGHCSLKLDDGTYISFWPDSNTAQRVKIPTGKTVSSKGSTYKDDVDAEGHDPDTIIEIRGKLNNQKIHKWWMENQDSGYHLYTNNCTNIVEKALEVGDLDPKE